MEADGAEEDGTEEDCCGPFAPPGAVAPGISLAFAAPTPISDETAKDHNTTAAVRNVAYRFVKGVLTALLSSMGSARLSLYSWLDSLAAGTGPRLLAAQPLIIKVLLASIGDVFGSRTTRP